MSLTNFLKAAKDIDIKLRPGLFPTHKELHDVEFIMQHWQRIIGALKDAQAMANYFNTPLRLEIDDVKQTSSSWLEKRNKEFGQ